MNSDVARMSSKHALYSLCFRCLGTVFCVGTALVFWLCCSSCTCRTTEEHETTAVTTATPDAETAAAISEISAPMRVVSLAGEPLSGMIPIATLQPNAFDEPVATGAPTNASGESSIRFPVSEKIALRAWDPSLLYFPNNFYEVLPDSGTVKTTLVVSMVKSASIEVTLMGVDGNPIRNDNAGIMLFHPVHGPWWPAEADTDETGTATFYKVPPGSYVLRIKVASGLMVELPETYIAPDDTTHLGAVQLL